MVPCQIDTFFDTWLFGENQCATIQGQSRSFERGQCMGHCCSNDAETGNLPSSGQTWFGFIGTWPNQTLTIHVTSRDLIKYPCPY